MGVIHTKAERNTQRERDRHCHPSVLCALPKAVPSEDLQPKAVPSEDLQPKAVPSEDLQLKAVPSEDLQPKAVLSEDLQQGVPTTAETDFPKTV